MPSEDTYFILNMKMCGFLNVPSVRVGVIKEEVEKDGEHFVCFLNDTVRKIKMGMKVSFDVGENMDENTENEKFKYWKERMPNTIETKGCDYWLYDEKTKTFYGHSGSNLEDFFKTLHLPVFIVFEAKEVHGDIQDILKNEGDNKNLC